MQNTTGRRKQHTKTSNLFSALETQEMKDDDIIAIIRKGIPKKAMDDLMKKTGITAGEMAGYIRTSDRTLRRYSNDTILNKEQSERILELALLYKKGEDVFESLDAFNQWMKTPLMALGNKKPKDYLDTSIGIEKLTHLLGRIEHGVYS